jgi:hypothetical protein
MTNPDVPAASLTNDVAWQRLEDQLHWYDTKSMGSQRAYKRAKTAQLILGSAVPVLALIQLPAAITATVAACVVVLEGVQQLNQWQSNWLLYRSTAEALKHERTLYLAGAGPYRGGRRSRVLAERVEGLLSQEHAKWTETLQETDPQHQGGGAEQQ